MAFSELKVYQISFQLEKELYNILKKHTAYFSDSLFDQIVRSSSSVSANIAEGWGKRYYVKEFIRFLNIALGSSDETQHHLKILYNREYIGREIYDSLSSRYKNLSVRLLNFIKHLKTKI